MIRFASLGSGSRGNALIVEATNGSTVSRVLIDCGFPVTRTIERLGKLGVDPSSLSAILITHEHLDHVRGAASLSKRFKIPIWMSPGTHKAIKKARSLGPVCFFDPHTTFSIQDFSIIPLPIPHDAREPVQFQLSDGCHRLVHLTDLGSVTPYISSIASGCDAMVIECNHDCIKLQEGRYSALLKRRIASPLGHLSNKLASEFVSKIDQSRLQHLVGAHLSEENNLPELAQSALANAVGATRSDIGIAFQNEGLNWRQMMPR